MSQNWLVGNGGVEGSRITTSGRGEADPLAPDAKPGGSEDLQGRQKNRRVEITVKK